VDRINTDGQEENHVTDATAEYVDKESTAHLCGREWHAQFN
jgi:hypothetical protein